MATIAEELQAQQGQAQPTLPQQQPTPTQTEQPTEQQPVQAAPVNASMPTVTQGQPTGNEVKQKGTPVGYQQVQQNQTRAGQSATNTASSAAQNAHQEGTSSKTFDAEANAKAMEDGQAYVKAAPSGYREELADLGLTPGGAKHDLLMRRMEQGVPFAQAVQDIATQSSKEEKEKAERLARTRNTMANAMEAFRLATDMASGFTGGNVYKRDGNGEIVAQNKADVAAADAKYQKALDDFNNNMRKLKSEDLAERKRRMAQLGEVGFGQKSTTDSDSQQQSNQSSATASTQSGSQNSFVQDQQFNANVRLRAASGGKQKKYVELSQPVVDDNGNITSYKRIDIEEDKFRDRMPRALSMMREWAYSPDERKKKKLTDIARNLNWQKADGQPDTDKVIKVLSGKYSEKDDFGGSENYERLQRDIVLEAWSNDEALRNIFLSDYKPKDKKKETIRQGVRTPGSNKFTGVEQGSLDE